MTVEAWTLLVNICIAFFVLYLKDRIKGLATTHDIGRIEKEIQEVRSKYSHDLELLRSELTKKSYIYGVRYENEFKLLKELWPKLDDLKKAAVSLRPEIDLSNSLEQDEKERRLERVRSAIVDFLDVADKNQPFFPLEICSACMQLMKIANKERIQYKNRNPDNDPKYWDSANKHAEEIQLKINELSHLIRKRITSYE